ncbi:selenophosphate synthase [Saccharicrinis carchari]|uniref:Selenide, water dikinase n=1 Tax=Saccharicrinis carchari TaxID=1168039 RepID=A0A521D3Z3_SACCC|nr:selenide, water dikinase SelD [Saccharicrinis carchari]SMO66415.1 selenophosphate synthase [Saccharicrinis carchari]
MNNIKLTQYSHGAGCGCKISSKVLDAMLVSHIKPITDNNLLVGNDSRDDAAVYNMGDGTGIISTTDFFMPIVDDPFTFGKIAAANAISDIYAMGGKPLMAIAILGWPVNKIPTEIAQQVLDGGRAACQDAGILLAGGHSIDSPEPIFGLAVTGKVQLNKLKQNNTATQGCKLYLTKPLGVGILTTAQKKGLLKKAHKNVAPDAMSQLNNIGWHLANVGGVKAMTDVTGFGLLGHLREMCEGSKLTAHINYNEVPRFDMLDEYLTQNCVPGGTHRNWDSFGDKIQMHNPDFIKLLCDPQTSGGLLVAVEPSHAAQVESLFKENNIPVKSFGELKEQSDKWVVVNE